MTDDSTAAPQANWTIADSGGDAKALYLNDTTLSFSPFALKGLQDAYEKNCPACDFEELGTNSGDIGTALPNKISSYLQAHPDVKYLVGEYCAMFTGVPGALATAGITGMRTVCLHRRRSISRACRKARRLLTYSTATQR